MVATSDVSVKAITSGYVRLPALDLCRNGWPSGVCVGGRKKQKTKKKQWWEGEKKARLELNAKQQLSRLIAPPE